MKTEHYRAHIDGLRCIAVLSVIFYHLGFDAFSGGFVGVDVFFVISGYLITGLIVRDVDNRSLSFVDFYFRRARRLFPALFCVVVATFVAAYFLFSPAHFQRMAGALIYSLVSLSNFYCSNR
jgi:peptidoglycan/LPS O-acetylase OafA/YrhL